MKNLKKATRSKGTTRRPSKPGLSDEEMRILQEAAFYCLHTFPMLWTVGGIKADRADGGSTRWIIAIHLRYPTGHEGYLGDLGYDGKQFTQLTDREVMRARAKQIAADPERMRKWNEYRASTLQAGEVGPSGKREPVMSV